MRRAWRTSSGALALGLALVAAGRPAGAGPTARVVAVRAAERTPAGTAFFLGASGPVGAAAVGTAHGLPLARLVASERVELELGGGAAPVVVRRLLAPPGRAYNETSGLLAEDLHVYALEAAPAGASLLTLAGAGGPAVGDPVEILGPPPPGAEPAPRLRGQLAAATAAGLEIDLPAARDVEGWGGAPVVAAGTDRVVGILEAVRRQARGLTLVAAPVTRLAELLAAPLAGGRGQAFAELSSALGPPPERGSALLRQGPERPGLELALEYPPDGSIVADSGCGAFVAGRAGAGALRRFDVIFALDFSSSTREPTGADINGNGIVGAPRLGPLSALHGAEHTDPGDSVAAAEIAGARALLGRLDPRAVRAGVVVFAGVDTSGAGGIWEGLAGSLGAARLHAETLTPLTRDYAEVERALDQLAKRTPNGQTHIAAGLDQAVGELAGVRGARSRADAGSRKVVFLFTDGEPTLPYPGHPAANARVVLEAAERARAAGVTVHTFAIGPAALEGPLTTLELAARTGGIFTPVRQSGDLALAVGLAELPKLSDLELESASGGPARILRVNPDGVWAGFVPVPGPQPQELRVRAFASDGSELSRSVRVRRGEPAAAAEIPAALAERRNDLLEECLRLVRSQADEASRLSAEQLRERLRQEILRERERANQRAREQRRELDLELERPEQAP